MCEAVDNWLSVFHFIVCWWWMTSTTTWLLSIQWITFFLLFHYLPDVHHCFWLLWLSLFISMYEKNKFCIWEKMRGWKSSDSLTMEFASSWVINCDGLMCLYVWQIWTFITMLKQNDIYEAEYMMFCFFSEGWKNQKWNKVFSNAFLLIYKDKSERFMTTQQCKYKS